MLKCNTCLEEKQTNEFFKHSKITRGYSYSCKSCTKKYKSQPHVRSRTNSASRKRYSADLEKQAEYREKNKENIIKTRKKRAEKKLIGDREYYEKNKHILLRKNSEWKKRNKASVNASLAKRRILKRGCSGSHSKDDVLRLLELQKHCCIYCKTKLSKYHVDHIFPLAKGGSNSYENIQILCQRCNMRKNAKDPIDFAQSMGLLC